MGIRAALNALLGRERNTPYVVSYDVGSIIANVMGMGPRRLFETQPHLRTVTTFVARNLAHLSLQVFERVSDTDRRRAHDDPAALLLARPNPTMTPYELVYRLAMDIALYDYALWVLVPDETQPSGWCIWPVPPEWVTRTGGGSAWEPSWVEVTNPRTGVKSIVENVEGSPRQWISFHGYDPSSLSGGISPVNALKDVLAEQIQAWAYRQQIWQRAGRVGSYLTRPAGAPAWSDEARSKFATEFKAKWTGMDGPKAGGTPILEDGMELKSARFNAREEEWSEVAKLSLATVAAVYHTSPTMVGVLDNANYSNVKEFSRMLYTDTLGPMIKMVEDRVNLFLLPQVSDAPVYAEFNVQEKLQGSFEEQAATISTSVGRPWMTVNEARAMFNRPALGGDADRLVTPLNVLVGGQASPRDSGSQNRSSGSCPARKAEPTRVKAVPRESDVEAAEKLLRKFFRRQRAAVLSALGAKDGDDWWDEERWDRELGEDLLKLALTESEAIARAALRKIGEDPDAYSIDATEKFLRAVASSRAKGINSATKRELDAALDDDLDEEAEKATPAGVFDVAETSRAEMSAQSFATTIASFAVVEAGRQTSRAGVTKTWVVNSGNPRSSHAAIDGETVGIDETFSNGARWPGDSSALDVDDIANCQCSIDMTIP